MIPGQMGIFEELTTGVENPDYLTKQLITYIGNKRGLRIPISNALEEIRLRVGGRKLRSLDMFSGSSFVSRLLKQHSELVISNDLESYAATMANCYLTNRSEVDFAKLSENVRVLNAAALDPEAGAGGFIRELYAPADDQDIKPGERAFYTTENGRKLDFYAQELAKLDQQTRELLLGPLISAASVHANTGGVFKGFYKDKATGVGKFGASGGDALTRILSPIELSVPALSNFDTDRLIYQRDANELASEVAEVDVCYIDPPYNQHPYGSNYFMLNLLVDYARPEKISKVSGIPTGWNRSGYNVKKQSFNLLSDLFSKVPARFLLVSFNSEGHVATEEIRSELEKYGQVDEMITKYNTYRASRNLRSRDTHVSEHLFLLDRHG